MDAPSHVLHPSEGGVMLDKIPLENCYGKGVVVDFRYMKKWHIVTPEDLEKAKPKIERGDFVVFNTGWHKFWRYDNYQYYNHYPGLGPEAAKWLVKKKVEALLGPGELRTVLSGITSFRKPCPGLTLSIEKRLAKTRMWSFRSTSPVTGFCCGMES